MKLRDLASVVRSKNAGPFVTTVDVLFDDDLTYRRVKESNRINEAIVSERYGVSPARFLGVFFVDEARAIKISFIKETAAGDPGVTDMYGCQQHAPLLDLEVEV